MKNSNFSVKMGRQGNFAEKPKKGPGRKAKKQAPPNFSNLLKPAAGDDSKKLSSRQKKRLKKRVEKKADKKIVKPLPEKEDVSEDEEVVSEDGEQPQGFGGAGG